MNIFQFIKRYKDFNKLMAELKTLEVKANIQKNKQELKAKNNTGTLSSYQRKKAEYARGKAEAYTDILNLFKIFMKNGEILKITNSEKD